MSFPNVKNILDEGLQFANTPSEKANIRLTNILSLGLVVLVLFVTIHHVATDGAQFWPLLSLALNVILLLYVIILNRAGHIQKSRIFLCWLVASLLILDLYILVQQQNQAQTLHYVRFRMLQTIASCIPFLIFDLSDIKKLLLALSLPLLLTILYDPAALTFYTDKRDLPLHKIFSYYTLATILMFATLGLCTYIVKTALQNRQFRQYIDGYRRNRQALELEVQEANLLLTERLKELNTLYTVTQIIKNPKHKTPDSALAEITNALPLGWQYPEICGALIQFNDKVFKSNYAEKGERQTVSIKVKNNVCGKIEVVYHQQRNKPVHVFLKEETELLNNIAEIIGTYLEERENNESYNRAQANLNATINNTEFLVYSVDTSKKLMTFNRPFEIFMKEHGGSSVAIGEEIRFNASNPNVVQFAKRFNTYYNDVLRGEQLNLEERLFGRHYNFSLSPIFEKESIIGVSVFGHDITELMAYRLSLEEKVRERTRELNESLAKEKELAAMKSQFASMVSHEFRTPLATIRLSANEVRRYRDHLSNHSFDEKIDTIIQEVNHMVNVLEDVLLIGKTQDNKIQANKTLVNLPDFFSELKRQLETIHTKPGHKIKCTFDISNPFFETDSDLLKNIFVNLLTNAIKFSPDHNAVYLRIYEDDKNNICFEVKDHGIGILAEEIERIFEPFDRGTNSKNIPGTGLGLAIVKKAVGLLNGEINVTSVIGNGSTFLVRLPRNS